MSRLPTEQPRAVWCCSTCGAIYHKDFPRCPIDGAEVVMVDRDPLLGSSIGNYSIERLIGEGGMGRVYLAHHANLPNKRYAVKVLLGDHSASAQMRARFTREAERASQLDHPNVAAVVDFGQTRHGLLYIVMDYVDGPSLVTLIGNRPMAPGRVIALTREICRALVYAHAAGIVHRDLKPENILVATGALGEEVPRLVDFGLAMSLDQSDARLTESGMTMGTPAFAAPEQLSGKAIDGRADLYALGMTMFEMLSGGVPPVEGHMMEVVAARTQRNAPRLSERVPHIAVPAALDEVVARLTRRKPDERYASALEVIDALDAVEVEGEWSVDWHDLGDDDPADKAQRATAAPEERTSGAVGARAAMGLLPPKVIARTVLPGMPPPRPLPGLAEAANRDAVGAGRAASDAGGTGAKPVGVGEAKLERGEGARTRLPSDSPGELLSAEMREVARKSPVRRVAWAIGTFAMVGLTVLLLYAALRSRPMPIARRAPAPPSEVVAPAPPAPPAPLNPAPPPPSSENRTPPTTSAPAPERVVVEPSRPAEGSGGRAAEPPRRDEAPRVLAASLDGVDVSGSLPPAEIKRAIQRGWPTIARCVPSAPETITARFTIGEARRARQIRTEGGAAQTAACITAALAAIRTEAAPDIGDVEVAVRIKFAGKT